MWKLVGVGISVLVIVGIYLAGYNAGVSNAKIEYVTKEVEVIKYVEKEKSKIYSAPDVTRDRLLQLYRDNSF